MKNHHRSPLGPQVEAWDAALFEVYTSTQDDSLSEAIAEHIAPLEPRAYHTDDEKRYIAMVQLAASGSTSVNTLGETALMIAASLGQGHWVDALLAAGSNPKARDRDRETALIHAARSGNAYCLETLLPLSDSSTKNIHQNSALTVAASFGHATCVKMLIPYGGADEKGRYDRTPLMVAALAGHIDCVEVLLPASSPDTQDEYGRTALIVALREANFAVAGRVALATDTSGKLGAIEDAVKASCDDEVMHKARGRGTDKELPEFRALLEVRVLRQAALTQSPDGGARPKNKPRRI